MKCPKCAYIGFEATGRCRNCGYDFSLADQPSPPADLSLREVDPSGPLTDLPLFSSGGNGEGDPRATPPPAPRAPLAVRRTPPAAARPKPRPSEPPAQPALDLEASAHELALADPDQSSAADAGRAPGVGRRLAASAIDALLLLGVNLVIIYFTLRVCRLTAPEVMMLPVAPMLAFLAIVDGGYLWAFTATGGQTIGKMALGLRAVGRGGAVLAPGRAVARAALSLASAAPLGAGLLLCLFGGGRRALHDWLAGTSVEKVSGR